MHAAGRIALHHDREVLARLGHYCGIHRRGAGKQRRIRWWLGRLAAAAMGFLRRERFVSREIAERELGSGPGVLAEQVPALLVLGFAQRYGLVVLLVVLVFVVGVVVLGLLFLRL